ncbi:peptide deformylase [Streptococcus entericus]|uniref:peptide deformylase n=1 Tax=Streptococcus entericus TaxID=155680 RepID=UPI000363DDDA|nr:peptide deformylase [Streptococcus entericus]
MMKSIVTDVFFLSQPSKPATKADRFIGQELQATLVANKDRCVGLAANMIGYHKRVIIIDLGLSSLVMFNPVLLSKSQPYETQEVCLSLSGSRQTTRYREIRVRFFNQQWQEQTLTLTDFPAQICQHELDHLDGILI